MIKEIRIEDDLYPQSLRDIKNPPKKLYLLGNESLLKEKCISVIGSRLCTEKGRELAEKFAKDLSKVGMCIVSGMAKGIDTAAHIGALKTTGKTIAVLGGGFNHIFPKENEKLFFEILERGGTIISEYEENVEPTPRQFVERNRIVSGLSMGVLVIEAKYRSGTSITADFAKSQNRKVFCIAHGIDEKEGAGTNRLIKNGAKLVTCIEDITNEFNINTEALTKQSKKQEIIVPKEYIPIYKFIGENPINADEICKKSNISISQVNYVLTMLELEGYIKQVAGGFFVKNE